MGKASKEEDRSREGTFRAISSLFPVVLRLDLSDIRWMDDSSVHTSRNKLWAHTGTLNVRVYAPFPADMREGRQGIAWD